MIEINLNNHPQKISNERSFKFSIRLFSSTYEIKNPEEFDKQYFRQKLVNVMSQLKKNILQICI